MNYNWTTSLGFAAGHLAASGSDLQLRHALRLLELAKTLVKEVEVAIMTPMFKANTNLKEMGGAKE